MAERKAWTLQEDQALKTLREQRNIKKWNFIAQLMWKQFGISGRNGKQCRERYHNHLDSRISKDTWSREQEEKLLQLHNQYGNRWATIARCLPGRTDNCVKNHFYACFRKSLKTINEVVRLYWKKSYKPLKESLIPKLIGIGEEYRIKKEQDGKGLFETCQSLKRKILFYGQLKLENYFQNPESKESLIRLIADLGHFNKRNKRRNLRKSKIFVEEQEEWENSAQSQSESRQPHNGEKTNLESEIGSQMQFLPFELEFGDKGGTRNMQLPQEKQEGLIKIESTGLQIADSQAISKQNSKLLAEQSYRTPISEPKLFSKLSSVFIQNDLSLLRKESILSYDKSGRFLDIEEFFCDGQRLI